MSQAINKEVQIPSGDILLPGNLHIPQGATGIVVFVHGSGSSRHSPRNKYVARALEQDGKLGTLLFDLLTPNEERIDDFTRQFRFDIGMLATRVVDSVEWLSAQQETRTLNIGLFGASTGGGAALVAAANSKHPIAGVISRGGRPDLAGASLGKVKTPTLLIVGGLDDVVIRLNEEAYEQMHCEKELKIVPGASHLFEEKGKLEEVSGIAKEWFESHLCSASSAR